MDSYPSCVVCNANARVFGEKSGYTLWKCLSCGLVFVHPTPNSATVYGEDYFAGASNGFGYVDYDADKEAMVSTFETYLARITPSSLGRENYLTWERQLVFF